MTPEQPKREAWEEKMMELAHLPEPNVLSLQYWAVRCVVDVALSTQAEELERVKAELAYECDRGMGMGMEIRSLKDELAAEVERFAEMVRQCESETKHESLAMVKPFCDSVVSRATLLSALCDLADELVAVKAELAAVRDELADMEFEAANLTDGADWQERSMRLKHRVSLLGGKLDALLKDKP